MVAYFGMIKSLSSKISIDGVSNRDGVYWGLCRIDKIEGDISSRDGCSDDNDALERKL